MLAKTSIYFMISLLSCHTESIEYSKAELKTFTLEELVPPKAEFFPDRLTVQWISDSEYIYRDPGLGVLKYNALTDFTETIFEESELYNFASYSVSSYSRDGNNMLLATNKKKIYRHSYTAEYAVYNFKKKSLVSLHPDQLQVVVWSSGPALAFVKENNVYYVRDAAEPTSAIPLTEDGIPGEVYFGVTDWIYEEEMFNSAEAMWFSPTSKYLAVASFNDTEVESAVYPYYGTPFDFDNQYPEMIQFKYPKAGRANPIVGLRVYNLEDVESEPWNIPAPVDVVGLDHVLGKVVWASSKNLVVLWLNRRQNISILVNCDLLKDKCSMVKEQAEPAGWIDVQETFFDTNGTKIVEISPLYHGDHRYKHAARFDFNQKTTEDLSPGNLTVTEVVGWKRSVDIIYYIVSPMSVPWQRQLWATSGGVVRCISCKDPLCHHVTASFSTDASYAIVTCSASHNLHKTFLYNSEKDSFKILKDNKRLKDKLSQYKLPMYMFNTISIGDCLNANVKLSLPPNMMHNQKYPLIVRVYAGPGTSRVLDNFDLDYYGTYLASNRSFIVASIDVRGSGVMGVEAMHAVNGALGTVEITDTLAAIRRLVSLYPFIDPNRIGVWGWSYGGFASTMMLIRDDQNIIKCGAAVAPVTSWLYYDTIYTERYMDTPQRNYIGYENADITSPKAVEKLRGRPYLLIHGSGDDNVHYQNAMMLAKQLQHADIPFEEMSYTDEDHSLLGVSRHLYHTLDRFWSQCFKC